MHCGFENNSFTCVTAVTTQERRPTPSWFVPAHTKIQCPYTNFGQRRVQTPAHWSRNIPFLLSGRLHTPAHHCTSYASLQKFRRMSSRQRHSRGLATSQRLKKAEGEPLCEGCCSDPSRFHLISLGALVAVICDAELKSARHIRQKAQGLEWVQKVQ